MKTIKALALEIAPLIGGTVDTDTMYDYHFARITREPDDLVIVLRSASGSRVEFSAHTALSHGLPRHQIPSLPGMFASRARDPAAIARELQRKVIEPSRPRLAETRTHRKALLDRQQGMRDTVAKWQKAFPNATIALRNEDDLEAQLYFNAAGTYVHGRLNSEGKLYIDRLSLGTAEQSAALFGLLYNSAK